MTERAIIAVNGKSSALARAIGADRKGKISILVYAIAIPVSFWMQAVAIALYVAIIGLWFIPDRRIERMLKE